MKNKKYDVLYCGVSKERIKNANPRLNKKNLNLLSYWINERQNIRANKEIKKQPKPWTQDEVLQRYRFCNVKREHDKETRWLIKNIVKSKQTTEDKILNIILFRLFNKSETIKIFYPTNFNELNLAEIRKKIENFQNQNPGYVYFSNAFFTSGPKRAANKLFPKEENMPLKIIKLVQLYKNKNITKKLQNLKNQRQAFFKLKGLSGIGDFLAYQIFVDLTYLPENEFPFSENEFVIAGPGCKKGLKLIFKDFDDLNYEEALFWIRDNQEKILNLDKKLSVMSLENCMCEISKYIRAIKKSGRPRRKYPGF